MSEAKNLFEAESKTPFQILSETNVGYYIPPYQRPFKWKPANVEKLEEDLIEGLTKLLDQEDSFCFLGSIITFRDTENITVQPAVQGDLPAAVFNLIDGQQRLSTLIMFFICLHNQIEIQRRNLKKRTKLDEFAPALKWLDDRATDVLVSLKKTFMFDKERGSKPLYPRIIRAFYDQWSVDPAQAKYTTPIASLIDQYITYISLDKFEKPYVPDVKNSATNTEQDFLGEKNLLKRYDEISGFCKNIVKGNIDPDLGSLPPVSDMLAQRKFQHSLFKMSVPDEYAQLMAQKEFSGLYGLFNLLVFASYVLHRVAITVVEGKNEDYAFNVFESLNTTGEPLTAYETFKPKVVSAETLPAFEASPSKKYLEEIDLYLSRFDAGESAQGASRNLLIAFHLYETGEKVSKKLSDQRKKLQDEYLRYQDNVDQRRIFLRGLRDVAVFMHHAWVEKEIPKLSGLPEHANTSEIRLCLAFLQKLNHTIALPLIARYYSIALYCPIEQQQVAIRSLHDVIRAVVSFSVLWRMSREGTKNIDQEYRQIMSGSSQVTKIGAFSRCAPSKRARDPNSQWVSEIDVEKLRAELRARLAHNEHGGILDKKNWIQQSHQIPIYEVSQPVARFVLLAAYHDAVAELNNHSALITKGRPDIFPCLTYEKWMDDNALTLEHIAPDNNDGSWDESIYSADGGKHRIGNLVFVPRAANSSLSNKPWNRKALLFKALGSQTHESCKEILEKAGEYFHELGTAESGISVSTSELVKCSAHMPQLVALGNYGVDGRGEWKLPEVEKRSERLLSLAWDNLYPWLN
jgi:hypothetical protein